MFYVVGGWLSGRLQNVVLQHPYMDTGNSVLLCNLSTWAAANSPDSAADYVGSPWIEVGVKLELGWQRPATLSYERRP